MFGLFLLALCITDIFAGKCTLRFEKNRTGIFWRNLGSNHVLLDITNDQIDWDDRHKVTGFCPGGFRLSQYSHTFAEAATFSCSEERIYWQQWQGSDESQLRNELVSCARTALYYEASIPMCDDYGLAYGFFVEGTPLVLAGACYDLQSMQTRFLHHVAGPQSSVVEYRALLNAVNLSTDALGMTMDCINIEDEKKILAQAVERALPKYQDALQFKLDDLISFTGAYFDDLNCVNKIPWWTSLKYGNWRAVEEIVDGLARYSTYDIYTGTSGIMTYSTDDKCSTSKNLTYEVNHYIREVPLHIWKYIKERNNDTDKGVVIVGINSPFVHHLHRSAKICSDMCEKLPWMEELHKTRKFPTLGLVFCCRRNEVEHKLDNFPSFDRSVEPTQSPRHLASNRRNLIEDTPAPFVSTSTSDPNEYDEYY